MTTDVSDSSFRAEVDRNVELFLFFFIRFCIIVYSFYVIDVEAITRIIMCACDDDGSGAISHEEATSDVCFAIHQEEVPEEDFDAADTNGDGEIDFDEAMAWTMSNAPATRKIAELRENFFSDDGANFCLKSRIMKN